MKIYSNFHVLVFLKQLPQGFGPVVRMQYVMCGLDAYHGFKSCHMRYLSEEDRVVDLLCTAFQTMHY
uniref:Putative ovule protein n=1 Tax=Solanum chacoense TaxID=4108 RepID=A0A0V0HNE5_SOLCH